MSPGCAVRHLFANSSGVVTDNRSMKNRHSLALALGGIALAGIALRKVLEQQYSFAGKTCIITGGSRGLGLVLARQICAQGARVALVARDKGELQRAHDELAQSGATVLGVPCDLCDRGQIAQAVRSVVSRFGRLDVVINNAGIIAAGPMEHMKLEDFERAMNVHFWGAYHVIMESLPHLRRHGGRIVNISSIGGMMALPHLAAYNASKFALVGLSDSLRAELAKDNIHITTVTPGLMRTGSHVNAQFKGDHAAEYAWFSLAIGLPVVSIKAERAAAKILAACRRGQPALTMPLSARAGIIGNAVFPNITGYAMKLVNRCLPKPVGSGGDELRSGWESRPRTGGTWLAGLAEKAVRRNNEQQHNGQH